MLEYICKCDRCGKRLSMENNRPIRGATFIIPAVTIYKNIMENAREVALCAECIDELNTRFFHF